MILTSNCAHTHIWYSRGKASTKRTRISRCPFPIKSVKLLWDKCLRYIASLTRRISFGKKRPPLGLSFATSKLVDDLMVLPPNPISLYPIRKEWKAVERKEHKAYGDKIFFYHRQREPQASPGGILSNKTNVGRLLHQAVAWEPISTPSRIDHEPTNDAGVGSLHETVTPKSDHHSIEPSLIGTIAGVC